jgi:hypothetical protein
MPPPDPQAASETIYQLTITLRGIKPPIWRRIQVPGDITLARLHQILQGVMGWTDSHLHQFIVGDTFIGAPDPAFGMETEDERGVRLSQVARGPRATFIYEYDFGDSWEHEILVENVSPATPGARYPVCLAGARACPPEDCGGIWGYAELLEIIRDPDHPEHAEMQEWLGSDFDPESFDLDEVNRVLKRYHAQGRLATEGRGQPGSRAESVPKAMRPTFEAIVGLTDTVCKEHLNEEYAQLCRQLAAALARKRPSPLAKGRPETWACGIAYTIGSVNFLFDKTQTPYMRAEQLCGLFGVSKSTGAAKACAIRDLFQMIPFDPRWCLPSKLADNPLAWLIEVDGLIVDARHAPRAIQEEAFRLGLIPYIPGA